MLYALWCLEDVERVDALVRELEDNDRAFDAHDAQLQPAQLQRKRERLLQKLRTSPHGRSTGMSREQLLAFPGMPNYKGQVS